MRRVIYRKFLALFFDKWQVYIRRVCMDEFWKQIRGFPTYCVSDQGRVRNEANGYILTRLINQDKIVYVGLNHCGVQHRRSLAILVANAHVRKPPMFSESFDTPIHRDGDRTNNRAINLLWRPRWFAQRYHRQFMHPYLLPTPVQDLETGTIYDSTREAAVAFGLLEADILIATRGNDFVWPTFQRFVFVPKIGQL